MMKRVLAASILAAMVGLLVGCNTMDGFGKDMERAGEKTQDRANR
jgi:entericidin A